MHLPWKRWVEVAAKEELCIVNWVDEILPPGPNFDIKKLGASELREIAGSYVDCALNGDENYDAFSVIRWPAGVWFICHYNNTALTFPQICVLFPTMIRPRHLSLSL
jgi:hypothetical protein